ncbi:MAG: twin-arginine translocation signal domain-containing protein [Lachnospiraceae bacterium]|nr:twin-arginine translocation signal domain-containing protein [Lachnospiraceae bacterium]
MSEVTRRDFLRGIAAGTLSIALAGTFTDTSYAEEAEEIDYENKEL